MDLINDKADIEIQIAIIIEIKIGRDIDRNINVLRQMKQIIDSQFSNLNKNIKIINGIQNDLNQLNRYGKIK